MGSELLTVNHGSSPCAPAIKILTWQGKNPFGVEASPGKFLVWNANQIKDFIPSLQIMKGLKESVTSAPKDSAVQKIQLALNNPDANSLEFDGNIIESRLKEKNLTAERSIKKS